MSSSKSGVRSKQVKASKSKNINPQISYVAKQVDTSIVILDSPEDSVVVEALLYLSEYAEIQENNLIYLYTQGLLQKLLNLLNRHVSITILALRFLGKLLTIKEVVTELDQDIYDDKMLEIVHMYISHKDHNIVQFCFSILSKVTDSSRITCLIFKKELFKPIFDTIKKTTDVDVLEWTLELLLKLVTAPTASDVLPEVNDFDISVLLHHLGSPEKKIVHLCLEIIQKITDYCLDSFQKMFREAKLIQTMFEIIMNNDNEQYHVMALNIICNSMKSDETSNYFVESLEFIKFCQWVKTCDRKHLFPYILILEQLTRIPSRRQMLFDLSVEHSILSFLRSTDKKVLNKTCDAISNMMTHRYCCEEMLKAGVLRHLFHMLFRKDQEDPGNEVALKTILEFSRRNLYTLDIIHKLGAHKVLLAYFKKNIGCISDASFSGIFEILYKMSLNPQLQQDLLNSSFFEKLLDIFQAASTNTATLVCEIMINLLTYSDFRFIFLSLNGPQLFVIKLQSTNDMKLLKIILLFIHGSLTHELIIKGFLQNNLVEILKAFPEHFKAKNPIVDKILRSIYNLHLPLKLFETNRLDITDKLQNKFYLICGQWQDPFPAFNDLEKSPVSTAYSIYVVDYSFGAIKLEGENGNSLGSESMSPKKTSSERTVSTLSRASSSTSSLFRRELFQINYRKLSPDPFLPRYIFHISKYLVHANTIEDKVRMLAKYIDAMLCEPAEGYTKLEKVHDFKLHVQILKHQLGNNMIPIGFLRLGRHCERALLFKAIADKCCIPVSLVRGKASLYWNEIVLLDPEPSHGTLKMYVVDLIKNIGDLLVVGSRAANHYCNLNASN